MKTTPTLAATIELCRQKILAHTSSADCAHDLLHLERVARLATKLCHQEKAALEIVLPAAWLHDLVVIAKNDPRRSQASQLSANAAVEFLASLNYPQEFLEPIAHAIAAHSFSANIKAQTLEAKIVQDADRLDGLGAIGIARCFATGAILGRPFYCADDPLAEQRSQAELDDQKYTIDHFFTKLFKTATTLQTPAGIQEGKRRLEIMQRYLADLALDLNH